MAFTEDLSVFFNTDGPGVVSALFTPSGGSASTVNGIFDKNFVDPLGIDGNAPRFVCPEADVTSARGGTLVIASVTYLIVNARPDGTGVIALELQEQ